MLAQGNYWRAARGKSAAAVVLSILRDGLPEELAETRDLRVEVPLPRWNAVVKHILADRRLLGGILLDYAKPKEVLATAVAADTLFRDLQNVVLDATVHLVEEEALSLTPVESGEE